MNDKEYKQRLKALKSKFPPRGRGVNRNIPETDRTEALALHAAAKAKPGRRISDLPFGCTAIRKWKELAKADTLSVTVSGVKHEYPKFTKTRREVAKEIEDDITAAVMNKSDRAMETLMNSTAPKAEKPSPGTIVVKIGDIEVTGLTFSQLKRLIRSQKETS